MTGTKFERILAAYAAVALVLAVCGASVLGMFVSLFFIVLGAKFDS
jgi:hypothetical protein